MKKATIDYVRTFLMNLLFILIIPIILFTLFKSSYSMLLVYITIGTIIEIYIDNDFFFTGRITLADLIFKVFVFNMIWNSMLFLTSSYIIFIFLEGSLTLTLSLIFLALALFSYVETKIDARITRG